MVDADDIVINGIKIRLHGIDAPEHRQLAKNDGRWYNQENWVKGQLIQAIGGQYVRVDVHGSDKYCRVLGVMFCAGKYIFEWMVREGLAIAAYSKKYNNQEFLARQEKLGIWGSQISYNPKYWKHGKKSIFKLIFMYCSLVWIFSFDTDN